MPSGVAVTFVHLYGGSLREGDRSGFGVVSSSIYTSARSTDVNTHSSPSPVGPGPGAPTQYWVSPAG
mgnify:CR=1 FL=1